MSRAAPGEGAAFSPRGLAVVVTIVALSLGTGIVLSVFSADLLEPPSAAPDAFSYSALGHRALVDLLRELDVPVLVSRHASAERAQAGALLVVAEPHLERPVAATVEEALDRGAAVLVVLPKWHGVESSFDPAHVGRVRLKPESEADAVLRKLSLAHEVVRPGAPGAWQENALGVAPSLPHPQLLGPARGLEPVVSCEAGLLVGSTRRGLGRLLVLADPDVLANHGIGAGRNALFATRLVRQAIGAGGAVVVDETLHGNELVPSLWRELFAMPLGLVVLHAVLAAGLLLWMGAVRFGAPRPPPPPFEAGKRRLVENTAELLTHCGHSGHSLVRYVDQTAARVAARLHVGPSLDEGTRWRVLRDLSRARGLDVDPEHMRQRGQDLARGRRRTPRGRDHELVAVARRVHRWKQEMLHGPRPHQDRL